MTNGVYDDTLVIWSRDRSFWPDFVQNCQETLFLHVSSSYGNSTCDRAGACRRANWPSYAPGVGGYVRALSGGDSRHAVLPPGKLGRRPRLPAGNFPQMLADAAGYWQDREFAGLDFPGGDQH